MKEADKQRAVQSSAAVAYKLTKNLPASTKPAGATWWNY